jgi:hypothetical protein
MGKNQRKPANGINCQNKFDLEGRLSPVGADWMKEVREEIRYSETKWAVHFWGNPFVSN